MNLFFESKFFTDQLESFLEKVGGRVGVKSIDLGEKLINTGVRLSRAELSYVNLTLK